MSERSSASTKRWIRPLPENVVNKIAAGEVIERPAAVIKELVENSLDSGATRIEVESDKAGIKLLRVVDNGCGIPAEQVEVAFGRHATSKISSFQDLDVLVSYGFRGEALPSIASVSRLRMLTRTADETAGTELIIEGGVVQSRKPAAAPVGTTVETADLFYNTPARRKFLRAEATEMRFLSRTMTALAISHPGVAMSYRAGGRQVFAVPENQKLVARVEALLSLKGRSFALQGALDGLEIAGCLGTPDAARNNRYGLYLFVNGRYIFSTVLAHAVRAGFGELIAGGSYPVGALLLTVDPTKLDVNVHPSKTEVRLSHEREIHDSVRRFIRDTLRQDNVIPVFQPGRSALDSPAYHGATDCSSSAHSSAPIPGIMSRQPVQQDLSSAFGKAAGPGELSSESAVAKVDTRTGEIIGEYPDSNATASDGTGPSAGFRLIGRFSNLYLLVQAGDDLYIVDQHTAHERVLYEDMLRRIASARMDGQNLLFPAQVELSPEQMAVFEQSGDLLIKAGFAVSYFGGRTINIEALPGALAKKSPEKIVVGVLDDIAERRRTGGDIVKGMAQSLACRAAVMAGDRLSDTEAIHLLEQLLACDNAYSCPHGRPTFVKISRQDLDRQFGRQ
ncbi:MAG: DNA mismatch repair endonuclease MutL [bacterium]